MLSSEHLEALENVREEAAGVSCRHNHHDDHRVRQPQGLRNVDVARGSTLGPHLHTGPSRRCRLRDRDSKGDGKPSQ